MNGIEIIEQIQNIERQRSVLDARLIRAINDLTELRGTPQYVGDEVAAALDWSPITAANVVHTAIDLAERLPNTVNALEAGQIDLPKARAILEWTEPLPVEQARDIANRMHDWVEGRPVGALRAKLSREVIKIDPQGAEERRAARVKHRKVSFFPDMDGMATLCLYDSADRVRAIYDLLDHAARVTKAAGFEGDLDMLCADAMTDLILGPDNERLKVELRVTIPANVLAGTSDEPGWLHGYGPITSEKVWELADQHPFWRRLVTDPLTGTVVEVGKRQPPTALQDFIRARIPTCTAPGCRRPAESCELDHLTDHAKGGSTNEENLAPACRHHNLMKLHGGWRTELLQPGTFRWITPSGLTYDTTPNGIDQPYQARPHQRRNHAPTGQAFGWLSHRSAHVPAGVGG